MCFGMAPDLQAYLYMILLFAVYETPVEGQDHLVDQQTCSGGKSICLDRVVFWLADSGLNGTGAPYA